jgi:nucleoside-diphosphate kinase
MTESTAERTLIIVKPDGVQRLLVGRILARFEERGLRIAGVKMLTPSRDLAERHYAVHRGKPFYEGLLDFITSGPVVAAALEGRQAVALARTMLGATRPEDAAPGTIRGDYALDVGQNLVHASDSAETAADELGLWFSSGELHDYPRDLDRWIAGSG